MKLKLASKAIAGYIVILLLAVLASLLLYRSSSAIKVDVDALTDQNLPALNTTNDINLAIRDSQISAYQLYGTTLTIDQYRSAISANSQQLEALLSDLVVGDASQVRPLRSAIDQNQRSLAQLGDVMSASSIDWDRARQVLQEMSQNERQITQQVSKLSEMIKTEASSRGHAISERLDQQLNMAVLLVLLVLATLFVAALLTKKFVSRPILALSGDLANVATHYDLTHQAKVLTNDEIGDTSKQLNTLLSSLSSALRDVQQAAGNTQQSVSTLSTTAETSDQQIDMMTTKIEELVNTMTHLEQHIAAQVGRSEDAARAAQESAESVEVSSQAMHRTSESIGRLAQDVESSAEELMRLHETSSNVGNVVSTIAEIAEQTNLLALNAAIEAARAGESGRGFAVVADEVRTLATRTRQSTIEINQMLEALVASVNGAVGSMQTGRDQASQSVELGQQMVASLNDIRQNILALSEESHLVAVETEQAGTQVSQLSEEVQRFSAIGRAVSEDSQRIKAEASSLHQQGSKLQATVSKFKI